MNNQIIVINKEKNYTSRDVVNIISKKLNIKKVGHTGTLDPLASGVLVCLTGKYTKLADIITFEDKEYVATIKLGIMTDTLDITGNVIEECNLIDLNAKKIENVLNSFKGTYIQEVPAFSAVHVNGKRLYEYARNKKEVSLPKRKVTIKEIELISYEKDLIKFKCLVSKGTYIRSLIRDICNKLNTLGVMSELVRTKQGIFSINDSYSLLDVSNNEYMPYPINKVLDLKMVEVKDDTLTKVLNGNKLVLNYNGYIMFQKEKKDIALYYFENNIGTLKILL